MLKAIYKLPKTFLAVIFIGGGIALILYQDPPHTFCDSQLEHFKKAQTGNLYKNPRDFHREKSILKRKQNLCRKENSPGACYDYFSYLKRLLRDFRLLSKECAPQIYAKEEVKQALSSALLLMTAIAFRPELLTSYIHKYNWLSRSDLYLFCEVKEKYIMQYGREAYLLLERNILNLLPVEKKIPTPFLLKKTILSEPCAQFK